MGLPMKLQEATSLMQASQDEAATTAWVAPVARVPSYSRRLSSQIAGALDEACKHGDLEVAKRLVRILEMKLARRPPDPLGSERRRDMETVVAAYAWLWSVRNSAEIDDLSTPR